MGSIRWLPTVSIELPLALTHAIPSPSVMPMPTVVAASTKRTVTPVSRRWSMTVVSGAENATRSPNTDDETDALTTIVVCCCCAANAAPTDVAPSIVTTQLGVDPEHAPVHPLKTYPSIAVATSVSTDPLATSAVHKPVHGVPPGPATLPPAPTPSETANVRAGGCISTAPMSHTAPCRHRTPRLSTPTPGAS